ncbi:MAG TPA: PIN domain-containing protein [Stellaceae bacterium]|nr:PIN domain-containing protein [Stellaceae bacterium]
MTASLRFTLDTNILVYAANRDAGAMHRKAQAVVRRAADSGCILLLQALAEFFRVAVAKSGLAIKDAERIVNAWRDVFPIHCADERALVEAMDAVASHNLAFWDAMLWATARRAGCRFVLSEDFPDGRELGGVVFLNPFAANVSPLLNDLLGVGP